MTDELPIRGHLLMIATGNYSDPEVWPALEIDSETQVWSSWLTDPQLGDRAFATVAKKLAHSPTKLQLEKALRRNADKFDRERDAVVCYITGHGQSENRLHRLVLKSSLPGDPHSMYDTHDVLEWLLSRVSTALVVIDTCQAGGVEGFLAGLDQELPRGWIVIGAASAWQEARLGALTAAVRKCVERGRADPASPYLRVLDLLEPLSESLHAQRWRILTPPPPFHDRLLTLPNPYYDPAAGDLAPTAPARTALALSGADAMAYWDARSRGVADPGAPGMLFTGRRQLMKALIAATQAEPGAWVITGPAGCGKSAALARLVTFSDPHFRATYAAGLAGLPPELVPPVGAVDIAVLAKGGVAATVANTIRTHLGLAAIDGEALVDLIRRIHSDRAGLDPVTIVVDALDEAADPYGIVQQVLGPLVTGEPRWLRLIVAVRGSGATQSDDGLVSATVARLSAEIIDATAEEYWIQSDVAEYALVLLTAPGADGTRPVAYADVALERLYPLTEVIASIAGTSYMLARMICRRLRWQPDIQDPDDVDWQRDARAGLSKIFEDELAEAYPDPERRDMTRMLLAATAFTHGRGLPRRIWPEVAQAIDPDHRNYTDQDIARLLDERISGYLVRDVDDDATVYRPFHDALVPALTRPPELRRGSIYQALRAHLTPARIQGLTVPPDTYLRRHLAEHAADGDHLDDFVQDATALTWADPDHLIPLLDRLKVHDARAIGRIYRTIAHTLRHSGQMPYTFPLQLRVRQAGLGAFADHLADAAPEPSCRSRWATPRRDSDHLRIDTPIVKALAVARLPGGTPVIVTGSWDETVRVWRLVDGVPVGEPMRGHDHPVESVAVGALPGGEPVIVSGAADGTIRVHRLVDGVPVAEPRHGHDNPVRTVAVGVMADGTSVVVSGSQDRTVRVARLDDGRPVGAPLRHDHEVTSVTVGALPDGSPVIVSGSRDRTVRVWRLDDGTPVGAPLRHDHEVTSVAVGALPDGAPIVVSGSWDETVRIWRLDDGAPVGTPLRGHHSRVESVTVGELPGGTPIVVSAGWDGTVRVWRLADGAPLGEPLRGHDDPVWAVRFGVLSDGTPVVVSAARDRTVRVWRLEPDLPVAEPERGHDRPLESVAAGALSDGTPVVVSASRDTTVRVWRLRDGTPLGAPLTGHAAPVESVAVGALPDGTPVIVSASDDKTLRVSRLEDGTAVGEPLRGHDRPVRSVAVGARSDGTAVIVSGGWDETVRVWRLADGMPLGDPLRGHTGCVRSVAVGTQSDGTAVIVSGGWDETVRVWRLADGAALGNPLRGHGNSVESVALGALPNGEPIIISGGLDATVRRWRLADGAPLGPPLRGHGRGVVSVAAGALRDGSPIIVSASADRTVRLWRLEDGTAVGKPLNILSLPRAVAVTADSIIVAIDNDLVVLDLPAAADEAAAR